MICILYFVHLVHFVCVFFLKGHRKSLSEVRLVCLVQESTSLVLHALYCISVSEKKINDDDDDDDDDDIRYYMFVRYGLLATIYDAIAYACESEKA